MSKRYIHTILLLTLAALLLSACGTDVITGSGHPTTETRPVSGFDRVELSGIGELIITQGDQESLEVEAEDNLLGYIETTVQGNTLEIGLREETWLQRIKPTRPIRYYLSMKDIRGVTISGSGSAEAERIEADDLEVAISGSGDIDVDTLTAGALTVKISGSGDAIVHSLTADTVETTISGAGGCELAGKVAGQQAAISGTGDYNAAEMESQTANIRLSGSGDSQVWVMESLSVDISGSGDVTYAGDARLSKEISGAGHVERIDTPHGD